MKNIFCTGACVVGVQHVDRTRMVVVIIEDGGYGAPSQKKLVSLGVGLVVRVPEVSVADELAGRRLEVGVEAAAGQPPGPQIRVLRELVQRQAFRARFPNVPVASVHATFARHSRTHATCRLAFTARYARESTTASAHCACGFETIALTRQNDTANKSLLAHQRSDANGLSHGYRIARTHATD